MKKEYYIRSCKRCGKYFKTKTKGAKICNMCYKKKYNNRWGVKGIDNRIEIQEI